MLLKQRKERLIQFIAQDVESNKNTISITCPLLTIISDKFANLFIYVLQNYTSRSKLMALKILFRQITSENS